MKRVMAFALVSISTAAILQAQVGKAPAVERCEKTIGTMAVNEPSAQVMSSMGQYGLKSPSDLLRMMIEDSQCFVVVERGAAMAAMQKERDMARQGDLTKNANVGRGQMQAADYVLTPSVVFSQED